MVMWPTVPVLLARDRTLLPAAPGALRVSDDHALNVARRNAPNAQRLPEPSRAATARTSQAITGTDGCSPSAAGASG
jgi:hypothetical protein